MRLVILMIYKLHQGIVWKNLLEIDQVNIACELMINGEFVLSGQIIMPTM